MATPQKSTVWYKNPWFYLACFAVLAFIGTQVPPDQSPASFVPSVAAPAPSVSVPAPVPATVAPPITNNNIILLGSQPDEIARLLDRVPVETDTAEPAPKPAPTVSRPSEPDCIDGLAAHRQRVKEWQDLMR